MVTLVFFLPLCLSLAQASLSLVKYTYRRHTIIKHVYVGHKLVPTDRNWIFFPPRLFPIVNNKTEPDSFFFIVNRYANKNLLRLE